MRKASLCFLLILLLCGTSLAEGSSSAGRYWINPIGREAFTRALRIHPDSHAPYFEQYLTEIENVRSFTVVDSAGDWVNIQLEDGRVAWLLRILLENSSLIVTEDPEVVRARQKAAKAREDEARRLARARSDAEQRRRIEERLRHAELMRTSQINAQAWSQEMKGLVRDKKIVKGMEPDMVKLSIGQPARIIETDVGTMRREEWFYGAGTILYFENDKLVGWKREK